MVRTERKGNSLENPVNVTQGFAIPKPKHAITLIFQICGAGFIRTPLERVLATVELDDEPGFGAAEVRDEGADGVLAAELQAAELPVAE